MKKLLILLLLLPASAIAQKWDVGLHGGVSAITHPGDWAIQSSRFLASPVLMVTGGRQIGKRMRIGLDVSATRLWRKADIPMINLVGYSTGTRINGRLCIGDIAFLISPSFSYSFRNVYVGGQLGYVALTESNNPDDYEKGRQHRNYKSGIFGGLHAGYVRSLSKAVDLHLQLRGNFVQADDRSRGVLWNRAEMGQAQATVGLHYRL